jgi:hypothetical protein
MPDTTPVVFRARATTMYVDVGLLYAVGLYAVARSDWAFVLSHWRWYAFGAGGGLMLLVGAVVVLAPRVKLFAITPDGLHVYGGVWHHDFIPWSTIASAECARPGRIHLDALNWGLKVPREPHVRLMLRNRSDPVFLRFGSAGNLAQLRVLAERYAGSDCPVALIDDGA